MKVKCTLELEFADEKTAKSIAASISVDDENYVETQVSGHKIMAEITAKSPLSLLHTVDDYLACVSVAEKSATIR